MELQTLTCGHCGAPLEIPTSVNYVTCRFCHNQLHVQRTESIAFTEVIPTFVTVTTNPQVGFAPQPAEKSFIKANENRSHSEINVKANRKPGVHPTAFPVDLLQYLLITILISIILSPQAVGAFLWLLVTVTVTFTAILIAAFRFNSHRLRQDAREQKVRRQHHELQHEPTRPQPLA